MFFYAIRRLIGAVILLFIMSIITFLLFYASPTDPARLTCGKNCSPSIIEANRHYLGYDKPITTQYFDFVGGIFHDRKFPADPALRKAAPKQVIDCSAPCLGYSPLQNKTVNSYLAARIPVTVSITLGAFVIWILGGVGFGIVAALFRGRWPDRLIVALALVFYSFPTFFIALLLYEFTAIRYKIFPVPEYISLTSDPLGWFRGLLLPWITLAAVTAAGYVRLTRSYILETMGEDYLRTARAKGVKEWRVVLKHTLRAALTPIVTISGLDLGILLGGAAITETVFNFQGLGRAVVEAAITFDLPTTVGIVLLGAAFIIAANLIVDLLYGVIDPRVRY